MTCYTYDSTNHRCTNTTQESAVIGARDLETFTILSNGKYKITVKGEGNYSIKHEFCANGSYGYNCERYTAAGGTNVVEKVLDKNTILKFIAIAGAHVYNRDSWGWGGSGVGLFINGNLFMVAGGGLDGGGYLGGWGCSVEGSGYSWDGTRTSFNKTYASGANGGAGGCSSWDCNSEHLAYGGSGYCADNTCVSTYGTASQNRSCWTTNSNGLPKGPGYATVVYCGPNANSTCP
jgi:hypothetical protein